MVSTTQYRNSLNHLNLVLAGVVLSSFLAHEALRALVTAALAHEHNSHIFLVLPVVVSLIWLERRCTLKSAKIWLAGGVPLLLAAMALALMARFYAPAMNSSNHLSLSIFSLVLAWLGLIAMLYGPVVVRMLKFPLLFLFLLVPLPDFILNTVTTWLQSASTLATHALFVISGVPVAREGFVLFLPHIDIEVAAECSGIRSTMMLLLTTLVLGHLYLRSTWRQGALFISVLIIAVLKNALRIFTLTMLAMYVDPSWLEGDFHHRYGGSVFFILALAMMLGVLKLLRRSEGGARFPSAAMPQAQGVKAT